MLKRAAKRAGRADRSQVREAASFVVRGYLKALSVVAAGAFLGGVIEALFLVTVTRAAFAITNGRDKIGIVADRYLSVDETLALAVGLVVARIGLAVAAAWQSARVSAMVTASLRRRVARAFLRAGWATQQDQRVGSLQEVITGQAAQASALASSLVAGIVSGANLLALVAMAVAIDPVGAVVLIASVGFFGLFLRPIRRVVQRRAEASVTANLELAISISEVSDLGLELHVFNVQDAAIERVSGRIARARDRTRRLNFASGVTSAAYIGLAYGALIAALAVTATSDAGALTSLGAAMLVMLRSLTYGQGLQTAMTGVVSSVPAVERLRSQMDTFVGGARREGGQPVSHVGPLEARNLTFAYLPPTEVLQDVSFSIEPHEVVGIVGPSGSGKSTLVQLLLGLREPTQGEILADGRNIADFDRAQWARLVTFVPQQAHLIAGSIADNIRFLRSRVTDDDVERAARLAHLFDDIAGFPEGFDRQVGERGGHLSGGQAQRLCIARALVEEPDLLILDEPTSALDVRSEHLVRSTLTELKERMTIVVIAHRLSTLDICDRIMVIQEGELRGFDTPANLEGSSDFYREALELSGMR